MKLDRNQILSIARISLMAVLVFLTTYLIKLPSINGYVHIGDSLVFLSVYFLGTKKGALASAIGACFADILGGYLVWALPTFIIKGLMAIVMGLVSLKMFNKFKGKYILGCFLGGTLQVILYAIVNVYLYGSGGFIADFLPNIIQTIVGTIIFLGIVYFLEASGLNKFLKNK